MNVIDIAADLKAHAEGDAHLPMVPVKRTWLVRLYAYVTGLQHALTEAQARECRCEGQTAPVFSLRMGERPVDAHHKLRRGRRMQAEDGDVWVAIDQAVRSRQAARGEGML